MFIGLVVFVHTDILTKLSSAIWLVGYVAQHAPQLPNLALGSFACFDLQSGLSLRLPHFEGAVLNASATT
jgi:hypothetical protein